MEEVELESLYPAKREANSLGRGECPNCRGSLIGDIEKGEILCPRCGYVALDQNVDNTPGWKTMDFEEREKRMHVGLPNTYSLHDFGLSTDISSENRDSHGKYLDSMSRATAARMQKWQRRIRTSNAGERSLSIALAKISEAADILRLPGPIVEDASHIFRKSAKMSVSKSKSIAGMATASLFLACRRSNVNRSMKEIAKAAGINSRAAAKYYRLLINEVENNYVPPPSVQKYISKLVNKEKINAKVERLALELADKANESEISSGKTPSGLAAAYVYIATVMCGEHIPQREIAEFAEVTEVTVRNRCREILNKFTIRQKLRSLP
ncbi:MAG: transcription initiation factor IIB [Nitrososphaerota archaeon]|nr:transcription initiation factor IIB [Nitrososphaerota archaeon]